MKKLLNERFAEYFTAMGYTQLPAKSRKYKLFVLKVVSGGTVHDRYVFLGNNGAVRVNMDSKAHLGSFSKTDDYRRILEQWEAGKEVKDVA